MQIVLQDMYLNIVCFRLKVFSKQFTFCGLMIHFNTGFDSLVLMYLLVNTILVSVGSLLLVYLYSINQESAKDMHCLKNDTQKIVQ